VDKLREKAIAAIIKRYADGSQPPWSDAYVFYRETVVSKALADPELLARFQQNQPLPRGYGVRVDERCVEYPWVFAHLDFRTERVLDAGSTLNYKYLLDHPIWESKRLHLMTLAPEAQCYWERGIAYLYEDLRLIPIRDAFYDRIICISTLEHIGFDNSFFTGRSDEQARPHDFVLAMREFRRVLKPGGTLLLTVPFGKYQNLVTQQVFDTARLEQAIDAFKPQHVTRQFYAYSESGWQIADGEQCGECEYVDWIATPIERRPSNFPVQPDGAVAARAVACLKLVKPNEPW
jgi:SAM-dependent methyltransferase